MKRQVGLKIKTAREVAKLTQEELAEKAGFSKSYISLIEADKTNPSMKALEKLAKALEVETKYFLEEGTGVFFEEYKDHLTLEENQFIKKQEFRPWITLAAECDKEGLTPEEVRNLIKMVMNLSKNKKPQI